jgi:hypothetical protein
MSDDGEDDPTSNRYKVGYRRPPVHSRFRPGQSGNPSGSSKRVRNRASSFDEQIARDLDKAFGEKFQAKNGRTITLREHAAKSLAYRATKSDKSFLLARDLRKSAPTNAGIPDYSDELRRKIEDMAARHKEAQQNNDEKE